MLQRVFKMRILYSSILLILIYLVTNCNSNPRSKKYPIDCIISFHYYKTDAVGPESLINILSVKDINLLEILLKNPRRLTLEFKGGIYDLDSLYFPHPLIEIYNFKDSSLIFEQDVFGLRGYSDIFIDSIIERTKKEISIEIFDTMTARRWIIPNCK
jgi:hypothetical protein